MVVVDRGRDSHDVELGLPQHSRVVGKLNGGIGDHIITHLIGGVDATLVEFDLGGVIVIADDVGFFSKSNCNGHTNIAQTNQRDFLLPIHNFTIEVHISDSCILKVNWGKSSSISI